MGTKSKSLIILSPGFPSSETDSSCLPFPQLFVQTLKRLYPELDIVLLAFQYPFRAEEYNWHGVRVIAFNGRNRGKFHRLLLWRSVSGSIKKIIGHSRPVGILSFWLGDCSLIASHVAKKYQLPCFMWLLGRDAGIHNRYIWLIRPKTNQLIALSDFIAVTFEKNYGIQPAHIIPPGIDRNSFAPVRSNRVIDVLGVGSLIPLKNYTAFIEVIKALVKTRPQLKAVICGKGKEETRLRRLITAAGLDDNLSLCGELAHADVLKLMQRSRILLHPSSYEGFATVLSEALYAGAQVVCFCQPMKQVFKNQHVVRGLQQMIQKTADLLDDPHLCHEPVLTWPIETTCNGVAALFSI